MEYTEIIATVAAPDAERAAALLRDFVEPGVWLESPFTQPDMESGAIVDRGAAVRIHAYVAENAGALEIERAARAALSAAAIEGEVSAGPVADEDWAESWKQHFHVERFGRGLVIVPSWREYDAEPDDVVLTLDPGMAFGTGQHETTRMCLEAIERHVRAGMRVLDVGCGSGILSVAAARLGATAVQAIDIDPNCIRITRENARANAVGDVIRAECTATGDAPLGAYAGEADVVVANIIARVIVDLARPLVGAMAPGGRLIASGIIGEREGDVTRALTEAGARVVSSRWMGDWRCLEAERTHGPAS
ncbi:MAG: 50S ribosomal protein L11 methyltransferase [Chloroflexota bacterium]|nr:50S ribosomal protein L11 methyltransferase [Chloroflexota bacterium]